MRILIACVFLELRLFLEFEFDELSPDAYNNRKKSFPELIEKKEEILEIDSDSDENCWVVESKSKKSKKSKKAKKSKKEKKKKHKKDKRD